MTTNKTGNIVESLVEILKVKKNLILQGAPGTGKTYVAKKIAENLIGKNYETSNQFKIVQFHPSYTYEDFVRGIVVTTDNDGNLLYTPTNKILADFAKIANDNYVDSQKEPLPVNKLNWARKQWMEYKQMLSNQLQKGEDVKIGDYILNDVNPSNIILGSYNISDAMVVESYIAREIDKNGTYSPKYFSRATNVTVNEFKKYLDENNVIYEAPKGALQDKIERKNFILIIDEINRANLPVVLGELVYAIEYRGSKIETMYNVEGDNNIILPPNLYIIGTMNTADRSVGHIDYAIRRRFAFEYIEPRCLDKGDFNDGSSFETDLFNKVQNLFQHTSWLSKEFDKRDVAIGHSYFITNKKNNVTKQLRIKYEIRPLLEEYVKDGILKNEHDGKTINQILDDIFK